jgi:hypothetical protein
MRVLSFSFLDSLLYTNIFFSQVHTPCSSSRSKTSPVIRSTIDLSSVKHTCIEKPPRGRVPLDNMAWGNFHTNGDRSIIHFLRIIDLSLLSLSFGGKIRTPFHQDFIFFALLFMELTSMGKE